MDAMRVWLHLALREIKVRPANPPHAVHDGGRHACVAAPRGKGDGGTYSQPPPIQSVTVDTMRVWLHLALREME
eukprot:487180-Prorocentrum_minimum.AAC.1